MLIIGFGMVIYGMEVLENYIGEKISHLVVEQTHVIKALPHASNRGH
jgi:hypothetical protein